MSNKIKFYHISRDATKAVANFFENKGIQPGKGRGYGGQRGGFYCWATSENADKYFHHLLTEKDAKWLLEMYGIDIRLKQGSALKLEVCVDKDDVCLPHWQLDNEQNKNRARGRHRSIFLDFWSLHKDLFNQKVMFDIVKKNGDILSVTSLSWNKAKDCPVITYITPNGKKKIESVTLTDTHYSYRTQAINDFLCHSSQIYSYNYNQLLLAAVEDKHSIDIEGRKFFTSKLAIKYCGGDPLECQNMSILKGMITFDPKNGGRLVDGLEEVSYQNYFLCCKERPYNIEALTENFFSLK
ncbi:MAG: hypothetical protein R3Y43_07175 [Alphaproteobacteria bacterium]